MVGALGPFLLPLIEPHGRRFGMLLGMGLFALSVTVVVI